MSIAKRKKINPQLFAQVAGRPMESGAHAEFLTLQFSTVNAALKHPGPAVASTP